MVRHFEKMHGLGNDFAVFDVRERPLRPDAATVRAIADRRTGIGFDQLVLVGPSDVATARMQIWNADGSEAETCGNALRCVALLLGGAPTIETGGGVVAARVLADGARADGGRVDGGRADRVRVELGEPRFGSAPGSSEPVDVAGLAARWADLEPALPPTIVDVGNPHAVFFVDDPDAVDLARFGPGIEHDPAFPGRTNVAFARAVDARRVELRMWERGAGPTRACGSGACATAVSAIRAGLTGTHVEVRQPGGSLEVEWTPGGRIAMTGPAAHVFTGRVELP